MREKYLVLYYTGEINNGVIKKREVISSKEMFDLVQKHHDGELDSDSSNFAIFEIGECLLDFS